MARLLQLRSPANAHERGRRVKRMHEARESVGLRPDEIRSLRKLLCARKAELLDSYSNLEDDARIKGLALLENESAALREIDLALERMDQGTYGACEDCGNPIGKARLRALPEAMLCRTCKSVEESYRN